jgi:hypothetical protein
MPKRREKDVALRKAERVRKTKNQILAPKILPGHVALKLVRCGKSNCKCARGERHKAFYHVTYFEGVRYRRYIHKAEVEHVRAACQEHRQQQSELRKGRRQSSLLIRLAKAMFREMAGS